jgi:cell division protein FtsB
MSNEDDLKLLLGIVRKAAAALDANRQQLAQEKQEFESLKTSIINAVYGLDKLPTQITDNVTSAVRSATTQVAPAIARELKGHLSHELEAPLASAKTHIANAAKVEQQLMGALKGFDSQVYWKLSAGVAIVALGALLVMFLALYWQRSSLTDLMQQKAQLQAEMPQLQATADYLKKHGGGIQYTTCIDGNAKHLCVLIKTDHYYGNATSGFYAVPVGD